MPLRTHCPGCQVVYTLPDKAIGQKVRCKRCQKVFPVPRRPAAPPPVEDISDADAPTPAGPPPSTPRKKWSALPFVIGGILVAFLIVCAGGLAVGVWVWTLDSQGGLQPAAGWWPAKPAGPPEIPKPQPVGEATLVPLNLNFTTAPPCLCWSADAKGFYFLTFDGVLRRISLDGLQEVQRADLHQETHWLAVSAEGLVVTLAGKKEIWLLDADMFQVKRKIPCPGLTLAVSAPGLSFAVADHEDKLLLFDLRTGKVVKEYQGKLTPAGGLPFRSFALTPDGKYILTTDEDEVVNRLRLDTGGITLEESSPPIGLLTVRARGFRISPDGNFVCLGCGLDIGPDKDGAVSLERFAQVYPVTNLNRPAFTFNRESDSPDLVGFDPKAGWIYTTTNNKPLVVWYYTGEKLKEFKFPGNFSHQQFLVHPDGKRILIMNPDRIYRVDLSN